jgi:hypothetical protein
MRAGKSGGNEGTMSAVQRPRLPAGLGGIYVLMYEAMGLGEAFPWLLGGLPRTDWLVALRAKYLG